MTPCECLQDRGIKHNYCNVCQLTCLGVFDNLITQVIWYPSLSTAVEGKRKRSKKTGSFTTRIFYCSFDPTGGPNTHGHARGTCSSPSSTPPSLTPTHLVSSISPLPNRQILPYPLAVTTPLSPRHSFLPTNISYCTTFSWGGKIIHVFFPLLFIKGRRFPSSQLLFQTSFLFFYSFCLFVVPHFLF